MSVVSREVKAARPRPLSFSLSPDDLGIREAVDVGGHADTGNMYVIASEAAARPAHPSPTNEEDQ